MGIDIRSAESSGPRVARTAPAGGRVDDAAEVGATSGARAQFEREALVHLDALYSFALKLARQRDDAEDLVSDTILRAFDRWEQYRLGTNIRAWLFTILYHVFVSRKRRIDKREVLVRDGENWPNGGGSGRGRPGRALLRLLPGRRDRSRDHGAARRVRSAVVLSDLQGLRYAEVAQALGVPEGTVKSRLFRGRRILQRKLAGYAVEMGYLRVAPAGCC